MSGQSPSEPRRQGSAVFCLIPSEEHFGESPFSGQVDVEGSAEEIGFVPVEYCFAHVNDAACMGPSPTPSGGHFSDKATSRCTSRTVHSPDSAAPFGDRRGKCRSGVSLPSAINKSKRGVFRGNAATPLPGEIPSDGAAREEQAGTRDNVKPAAAGDANIVLDPAIRETHFAPVEDLNPPTVDRG